MNYGDPLEIDTQGKRLSSTFRNLILAISVKDKAKQNRSEAKTRLRQPQSE